jgi:glycosyltransferase involved in cell wall biosynthesis
MRLIININCYNEEETLPLVLNELPTQIDGIDQIEVQIVDDGSEDGTAAVAESYGARVVRHKRNRGLGAAFRTGVMTAMERRCDIMVNTDADNQYPSEYIPTLVQPIMTGQADVVIGNRVPWNVKHFGLTKRLLQLLGNAITRRIAGSNVPDTISGFRAYSAEALLRINVFTTYSYTLDTLLQAAKKGLSIVSIPIKTNPPTRESRLFKNAFEHVVRSASDILMVSAIYAPFKFFAWGSVFFLIPAAVLLGRYIFFVLQGNRAGHIQSLVVSTIGFTIAGVLFSLGVIAGLVGINRRFVEDELYLRKKQFYYRQYDSDIINNLPSGSSEGQPFVLVEEPSGEETG